MEVYFSEGFLAGLKVLIAIIHKVAIISSTGLMGIALLKIIWETMQGGSSSPAQLLFKFLRPMVLWFLLFTYTDWTNLLGGVIYNMAEYVLEESGKNSEMALVDNTGKGVNPWAYYNLKMGEFSERNETALLFAEASKLNDDEREARKEELQQKFEEASKKDREREMGSGSYIDRQFQGAILGLFNWLVEGIFMIVKVIIEMLQQAILAFIMAVGVLAIMISFIPGREGSLDGWITYFLSVQLWSLSMVILNVFFDAAVISEVQRLADFDNRNMSGGEYWYSMVNYIGMCVTFVLLYISVPFMSHIFMNKVGGGEFFSKLVGLGTAGTSAIMKGGQQLASGGKSVGGGMITGGNIATSGIRSMVSSFKNLSKN